FASDITIQAAPNAFDTLLNQWESRKFARRINVVEIPVDMQRRRSRVKYIDAVERGQTCFIFPLNLLWLIVPQPECDARGGYRLGCPRLRHIGKDRLGGAHRRCLLQNPDISGLSAGVLAENDCQLRVEFDGLAFD